MRTGLSIISIAVWLVGNVFSQNNPRLDKRLPKPIARISYSTGHIVDWNQQQGPPRFCFALLNDGFYRMSRLTPRGDIEKIQGILSTDQLAAFEKLLDNVRFQNGGGGIVQNGAEAFVAEIFRDSKPNRYSWVDPDHRKPLPDSASTVVNWLQNFTGQNEEPINVPDLTTDPICPAASENPVPLMSMIF